MTVTFKEYIKKWLEARLRPPVLDQIVITEDGDSVEVLQEGKWIPGRYASNIRIDQPTHGTGQPHAHVMGRKKAEVGVVNLDGSSSHGTKCRLHKADADALRARGFRVRDDNIVEWVFAAPDIAVLLLG